MAKMGRAYREPADSLFSLDETNTLAVRSPIIGIPTQKYFTLAGDGLISGTYIANGNYATPTDFYYLSDSTYDVKSILITITDNANFNQEDYGGLAAGTVVNGVKFFLYNSDINVEIPLLSGKAFFKNYHWFEATSESGLTTFVGTAQTLRMVFNMENDYGTSIRMFKGWKFIARLNDNFTGLVSQTFGIRGIKQAP